MEEKVQTKGVSESADMEQIHSTSSRQADLEKTGQQTAQNTEPDGLSADGKNPREMTPDEFIEKAPNMTLIEIFWHFPNPNNMSQEQLARCAQFIPDNLKNKNLYWKAGQGIVYECENGCPDCPWIDGCDVFQTIANVLEYKLEEESNDPQKKRLKVISLVEQGLSCEELYNIYCEYSLINGRDESDPWNIRELGKIISEYHPEIKRVRLRRDGRLTYVYKGLTFNIIKDLLV
jgi:hypothetical protein